MIPIPEELLEQLARGNVLLFVGERIVRDAEGQAVVDRLAAQLVARSGLPANEDGALPEAAQAYQDEKGRQALVQFLRDELEALGDEPQRVHHLIAGLADCDLLVTTCLDRRLERAFEAAGRPLDVIISALDVAFEQEHRAQLYKLRGSLDRVESLVLTEDDYETFFEDQDSLSVVLQGDLARKTILFVGYDLADPHFKRLYRKVTAPLDRYARRAYAFGETPAPQVCRWCQRHGIDLVEADATAFLESLTRQLAARARPAPAVAPPAVGELPAPLPERPYKLLDYYEARDAVIFFGRQGEIQKLSSLIHAHRLVLLYSASGAGKTSLLLAGVAPRLEQAEPPYEILYVRALEDPVQVIRRAVRRKLPEAGLPEDGPLLDLLDAATKALGRTLVLVLDQFEEFFIRLSPQFRAAFIAELGALYDTRDVPVKVVLSLREDWLAAVNEIRARIPEVFYVDMRLLPLARAQAEEAITAPVERLGIGYEPALVAQLLDDLGGAEAAVMPPQLQLVCSALYDGLGPDERRITLAAYDGLGGARGVLRRYLDDALGRLGRDEAALARTALEELVTSQGTKAVRSGDELALALGVERSELEAVLEKMVRARLLRVLERGDGGTAYELAHEYLIAEISLEAQARKRKQAEELLSQELENWQRLGTLLAVDKLALLGKVREELRLNGDAQAFLLRSALQVGQDVDYWLTRVAEPDRLLAVLAEAANRDEAAVRQRAAEAMGSQDVRGSVAPLRALALHDGEAEVRAAARVSLAALSRQRPCVVAELQNALAHADRTARRRVFKTLAQLPMQSLPLRLRPQVAATRMRPYTAWFWGWVFGNALIWPSSLLLVGPLIAWIPGSGWSGDVKQVTLGHLVAQVIFGLVLGAVQWYVVRKRFPQVSRWLAVGVVGGILGLSLGLLILWALSLTVGVKLGLPASGAALGTVVGGLQWLFIVRGRIRWSLLWVVMTVGSVALVSVVYSLGQDSDFVSMAVVGLVIGLVTGIPLLWLWWRFELKLALFAPVLLSIMLGAFLWGGALVMSLSVDPLREEVYPAGGVPLEIRNLPEELVLLDGFDGRVQVGVLGRESTLIQGDRDPGGVAAWVDLGGLGPGVHSVPVLVASDLPVRIVASLPQEIYVRLDQLAERDLPVEVTLLNRDMVPLGYQVLTPTVEPPDITLRGPISLLDEVDRAVALVEIGGARATMVVTTPVQLLGLEAELLPIGTEGSQVQIVPAEHRDVRVTVPIELQ